MYKPENYYPLFLTDPVNRHHSFAPVLWLRAVPEIAGGQTWYDLCGQRNAALNSMANGTNGWRYAAPHIGGLGALLTDGSAGYMSGPPVGLNPSTDKFTLALWVNASTFAIQGGANQRILFLNIGSSNGLQLCTGDGGNGANTRFSFVPIN